MANYKYEVLFGNDGLSVKVNTLEEAEELKREQEIMRNDDLRDEYRERGLDPRDFYSEVD